MVTFFTVLFNNFSGMNLETAAVISELIVDRTLTELEGSADRLVSKYMYMYTVLYLWTDDLLLKLLNTFINTHVYVQTKKLYVLFHETVCEAIVE